MQDCVLFSSRQEDRSDSLVLYRFLPSKERQHIKGPSCRGIWRLTAFEIVPKQELEPSLQGAEINLPS